MKEIQKQTDLVLGCQLKVGLKECGPNGLSELITLEEIAFGGHGEDAYTLKMIDTVGIILGATAPVGGSLVGAIEVLPIWKHTISEKQAFIHGVLVHPDYQSHGLGSMLIEQVTQKAILEGYETVSATIAPSNGSSLKAFLNKNHFLGTMFQKNFYGSGEHRFWVQKDVKYHKKEPGIGLLVGCQEYDKLEDLIGNGGWVADGIQPKAGGSYDIHLSKLMA